MEFNNTPVRTSKNFNINNIKLDVIIPENLSKFSNACVSSDVALLNEDLKFVYGVGLDYSKANYKGKIELKDGDDVKILFNFDKNNLNLIDELLIEANGNATITIEYKSSCLERCFHSGALKLIANASSNVNVNLVNFLNEDSANFEAIENVLNENSNVNYTIIDIGAKTSVSNYYSNIVGDNSKNDLKTVYLGTGEQVKDINYIAELYGKKTNIDIDVQGALSGKAKKNFKGTIDFKKGCKKAKGDENEFCMLLSDNAKSIALPMLLCSEDDVEGNHSTASGKVDNQVLFYIMSRGLSYKEAVKLLVKSNFVTIIDRITDNDLKNEIIEIIDKKLD
mgnify:FL=1